MLDHSEDCPAGSLRASQTINGLLQDLTEKLDARMASYRGDTDYAKVRPSDAKIFMLIARNHRTISQLARTLHISRQAAHASIGRLVHWKMVELQPAPGSRRDKVAIITATGQTARTSAAKRQNLMEADVAALIGKEQLEILRGTLQRLLAADWPALTAGD